MASRSTISLRTKISVVTTLTVTVVALALGALNTYNQLGHIRKLEDKFLHDSVRSAASISYVVMPSLVSDNFVSMNGLVSHYARGSDRLYVVVVDNYNRIMADSVEDRIGSTYQALNTYKTDRVGEGTIRRFMRSGGEAVEVSYPIKAGDLVVGNVVIGLNMGWLKDETGIIRETMIFSTLIGLGVISLGLLLASVLARRVSQPIRLLTEAAEKVGRGDYSQRIQVKSRDEVGLLADTFSTMVAELRGARAQLVEKEALRESEQRYRSVVESVSAGIAMISPNMEILSLNGMMRSWYPDIAVEERPLCYRSFYHPPRDEICSYCPTYLTLKDGQVHEAITERVSEGKTLNYRITASPVTDQDGNVVAAIEMVEDVTERRNLQARLEEKTAEQNTILENTVAGIAYLKDRRFVWFNSKTEQMFGYSKDEMKGLTTETFYPSRESYEQLGKDAYPVLAGGDSYTAELLMKRKDGSLFWCSLSGKAVDPSSSDKGSIWILHDITERRLAEEKLRASLLEKEILLKEVHHRVKNNLQVVASMLRLQSQYLEDEKAKAMFEDSQRRVESMSLIHEKLYRSKDLAKIDFREYIGELVGNVTALNGCCSGRIRISLDVLGVMLDVNKGIPCGLIINELVSNALRHAFPDGREGEVAVRMRGDSGGRISLVVSDNGVGFPADIDFRNTKSLGMQLVISLVGQLDGTIEMDNREGTAFAISFQA